MKLTVKENTTEELEHIVTHSPNAKQRVEALLELSHRVALKDLLRSWLLAREAERDSEELEDNLLLAKANIYAGNALWKMGDYMAAQKHYMKAAELYESLNDHSGLGSAYMGLGIVHGSLKDFPQALEYFEKALAQSEISGNTVSAANAIGNIGSIHHHLENYSKAEAFFHKALEMHEQMNEKPGIANMLNGLAGVKVYNGKFDQAVDYLNRFMDIVTAIENNHGIATGLMNFGILHHKKGDYRKAIDFLEKALLHAESKKVRSVKFAVHKNMADVYTDMGKSDNALEHYKHYFAIEKEIKAKEIKEKAELFERMKNAASGNPARPQKM
ncbi:MAG: Photosystem I assembly protein Ycf3 [Bacteroidia bacterium]|nr:Photosystem I assembly protein Ycf3 [Bacteroidia bacterium]